MKNTIGLVHYGECAVLGNGTINVHAGKRFDLHGLLRRGFLSKKHQTCYTGLIHRFYPLFSKENEDFQASTEMKSSDFSWNWIDDAMILQNRTDEADQITFVKHDQDVIINSLRSEKPYRYVIEFPFDWEFEIKENEVSARSGKWESLLINCVFNGNIRELERTEFVSDVADFAIPDAPEISVIRIVLEVEKTDLICIGVGDENATEQTRQLAKFDWSSLLEKEKNYWRNWNDQLVPLLTGEERVDSLYRASYRAIESCTYKNGAIMAGDRGYYHGVFTRDNLSSMAVMAVNGKGARFKEYWKMLLNGERDDDGRLFAAYDGDGGVWNPSIEIDQYAMIPLAVYLQYAATGDMDLLDEAWPLIEDTVEYFFSITPEPHMFYKVYDEWFSDNYTSPLGSLAYIYAGFVSAAKIAKIKGRCECEARATELAEKLRSQVDEFMFFTRESTFARAIFPHVARFDLTADAYILHASRFAVFNEDLALIKPSDYRMQLSVKRLGEKLLLDDGTLCRHEKEKHSWAISTMWLAQHYFAAGQSDKGMEIIRNLAHKNEGNCYDLADLLWLMPEQWNGDTGAPWRCDLLTWSHGEALITMIFGLTGYRLNHERLTFIPDLPKDIDTLESFVYHMGRKVEFVIERDGNSMNLELKNYSGPAEIWVKLDEGGSWLASQYFDSIVINGSRVKPEKIRKIHKTIYAVISIR
jgi:hypothetical protein